MHKSILRALFFPVAVVVVGLVAFPRLLPSALAWHRPDILFRFADTERILYLTIDDGPSAITPQLLDVLKMHGVQATFFITSDHVHSTDQIAIIQAAGHDLAHHMKTTERCSAIPLQRFKTEFDATYQSLSRVAAPTYFRPPSDLGTREQTDFVISRGCQPLMGTVFPLDHWIASPWLLRRLVRWMAVPGGIIILHDGNARGRTTALVLDELLPELKSAGYQFRLLPK